METLHGRKLSEQPQQLPKQVLAIANLPDPGEGNALHPQQATIMALANLISIRDSLYHFSPPDLNAEPKTDAQQFRLEQVDKERSNYSVAVQLLEHALREILAIEFGPAEPLDCYDQSLLNLAASLPFLDRYDTFFMRPQEQRFPTYPGNGSGQEQFDIYANMILEYRDSVNNLTHHRPEFRNSDDSPLHWLEESHQLLPGTALLAAIHQIRPAHSDVLNPDHLIEDPAEEQILLFQQADMPPVYRRN